MDKKKPQLTDEQKRELQGVVKAQIRSMLANRQDLTDKAAVMQQVWKALAESPVWRVALLDRPEDTPQDETWSMVPIVKKP